MSNEVKYADLKTHVRPVTNRNRMTSARIPDKLYRALAMWSCDNNVSISESIRIAVDLLVSPANRKDELFDRLEAIERKVDAVSSQTGQVSGSVDVVRELVSSLAKYVFFYAVPPADQEQSKLNMDARFNRFIKVAAKRVLSRASHFEIAGEDQDNGGFL